MSDKLQFTNVKARPCEEFQVGDTRATLRLEGRLLIADPGPDRSQIAVKEGTEFLSPRMKIDDEDVFEMVCRLVSGCYAQSVDEIFSELEGRYRLTLERID